MQTYNQYKDALIKKRMSKYSCSRKEAEYSICSKDWWRQEVLPALERGEKVTPTLARSMKKNGICLKYICKHYPNQWPLYLSPIDAKMV